MWVAIESYHGPATLSFAVGPTQIVEFLCRQQLELIPALAWFLLAFAAFVMLLVLPWLVAVLTLVCIEHMNNLAIDSISYGLLAKRRLHDSSSVRTSAFAWVWLLTMNSVQRKMARSWYQTQSTRQTLETKWSLSVSRSRRATIVIRLLSKPTPLSLLFFFVKVFK